MRDNVERPKRPRPRRGMTSYSLTAVTLPRALFLATLQTLGDLWQCDCNDVVSPFGAALCALEGITVDTQWKRVCAS